MFLLDFHALPGGANGNAHSRSGSGKADFWRNRSNQELATEGLVYGEADQRGSIGWGDWTSAC